MNTELIQKGMDIMQGGLIEIQQRLGVASGHIWDILVRQSYVTSFSNLVYYLIVILFDIILYKVWKWAVLKDKMNEEYVSVPITIGTILAVVSTIICIASIHYTVTGLVNPEYMAIERVVDMFGTFSAK